MMVYKASVLLPDFAVAFYYDNFPTAKQIADSMDQDPLIDSARVESSDFNLMIDHTFSLLDNWGPLTNISLLFSDGECYGHIKIDEVVVEPSAGC